MLISSELRNTAQWMADELAHTRLRVILVPDLFHPEGIRRLRAVEEQNPAWYRKFCEAYPTYRTKPRSRKKNDTAIKRRHTLRALHEIATGQCRTTYAQRILPYIQEELEQHHQIKQDHVLTHHDIAPIKHDLRTILLLIG